MTIHFRPTLFLCICLFSSFAVQAVELDERPARDDEWGYRPTSASVTSVNPPSFCWRPQRDIATWEIECSANDAFKHIAYRATGIVWNVHCPDRVLDSGDYVWRYRGVDKNGRATAWSRTRSFTIPQNAKQMPMPTRDELLSRIPKTHPRLFIRPDDLTRLRELARGDMKDAFDVLVAQCDRLLIKPPPTKEPPKYPADVERGSDPWRKIWWSNRTYTSNALNSAATLAFTRLLGGKEEYGQLAKRILLDCAAWDPKGATGYRYNDEAGMPYAYYFVRTYTFVYDLLSEEERAACRRVMKIRGDEMYRHLCPRHLWQPYASHSNRAWHFLGEVGIAMLGEVDGADDWVWFAMNVFRNVYPVWCDEDGGWHEGSSYWSSYISRFTWWADVMRAAMNVNAYDKPYFSRVGYYPMYLMPPGKKGGGFGDLTARMSSSSVVPLMTQLAAQSGNEHWQWYVQHSGGPRPAGGYVGFVRGALPKVAPKAPDDLPTSRQFRGIGQAFLNTTLKSGQDDVQVVFKSSPFGTQSHGYESNNAFLLSAYGKRLLIRSGYRDSYGSDHHRNWMWSTRSVNCITVNGQNQLRHSSSSRGHLVAFKTTASIDAVVGEAGETYRPSIGAESILNRFTRTIVFVKPDLVVVYDQLDAKEPSTFQYWLHATNQFQLQDDQRLKLQVDDVTCDIALLAPRGLEIAQTNQYDPNPRPRITLREWHLTATTKKTKQVEFIAVYRPRRNKAERLKHATLKSVDGGYVLNATLRDGRATLLLPTDSSTPLTADGISSEGKVVVERRDTNGTATETLAIVTQ